MGDIKLDRIYKKYGETAVFEDFGEIFGGGEAVAIMGPSGSGKTTLLRLIMGLEKPDSGEITGIENEKFACVFQENRLIEHCNAVENIRLVVPARSRELLLPELERFLLKDCADQPASELSGGMARRTALLRALLSDTDLLLLDEPFTGLDGETLAVVLGETCRLLRDRTCVLVTHRPEEAEALGASIVNL